MVAKQPTVAQGPLSCCKEIVTEVQVQGEQLCLLPGAQFPH